jgi:hypothetical protein
MPFPTSLVPPPQRTMSKELKSALLLKAIADNNPEEVSRIKLIDWYADNIYPPERFDTTGRYMLPPVRKDSLGNIIPERINIQRARGVRTVVNAVMPVRRPRRLPNQKQEGKTNDKDRSLIGRKVVYNFSANNFRARRMLRQMLLGYKVKINYDEIKRELLHALDKHVCLLPWNRHYEGWNKAS